MRQIPLGINHRAHTAYVFRGGTFILLRSPGIDSINSASLCSLAGRYDNPIPTRFLALIDCYKIPALIISQLYRWHFASKSMKFT
jgi:hypothetical protein